MRQFQERCSEVEREAEGKAKAFSAELANLKALQTDLERVKQVIATADHEPKAKQWLSKFVQEKSGAVLRQMWKELDALQREYQESVNRLLGSLEESRVGIVEQRKAVDERLQLLQKENETLRTQLGTLQHERAKMQAEHREELRCVRAEMQEMLSAAQISAATLQEERVSLRKQLEGTSAVVPKENRMVDRLEKQLAQNERETEEMKQKFLEEIEDMKRMEASRVKAMARESKQNVDVLAILKEMERMRDRQAKGEIGVSKQLLDQLTRQIESVGQNAEKEKTDMQSEVVRLRNVVREMELQSR